MAPRRAAILLRVSLENADPQSPARANRVELVGCDGRFWRLGSGGPRQLPQPHEIVLNQPLAEQLGVRVGDAVLLRLPRIGAIPADSALGRKRETVGTAAADRQRDHPGRRARAVRPAAHAALAAERLCAAGLAPRSARQPGRANAILVAEQRRHDRCRLCRRTGRPTRTGSRTGRLRSERRAHAAGLPEHHVRPHVAGPGDRAGHPGRCSFRPPACQPFSRR